jgi:hypothetical protein
MVIRIMKYEIELNDAQVKALSYVAYDPQDWIQNAASNRARIAIEEIFQLEVARMLADPTITEIPADREAVVLAANITSAKDREDNLSNEIM